MYEGIDSITDKPVVLKILKPVRKVKISREIRILQILKGGPHIIELLDCCLDSQTNTPSLVFEYLSSVNLKSIMGTLTLDEIKAYIFQVLEALHYCHSHGIIHRDIKPMNLIVDNNTHQLKVIDWGLSEFYHPDKELNTRVSSRPYKSPELLVGFQLYDFSMDIWSLGCMFAAMIFRKEHFFLGKDNGDQLIKIIGILGSNGFFEFIKKYKINVESSDFPLYKKFFN